MSKTLDLAVQAASLKGWPAKQDGGADVRIEVPTVGTRTQVVTVVVDRDADGDAEGFIFSKFADANAVQDPWSMLKLNAELSYGKVALRGSEVVIVHGIHDDSATLAAVGKAIYWVARAADDLESKIYGADNL